MTISTTVSAWYYRTDNFMRDLDPQYRGVYQSMRVLAGRQRTGVFPRDAYDAITAYIKERDEAHAQKEAVTRRYTRTEANAIQRVIRERLDPTTFGAAAPIISAMYHNKRDVLSVTADGPAFKQLDKLHAEATTGAVLPSRTSNRETVFSGVVLSLSRPSDLPLFRRTRSGNGMPSMSRTIGGVTRPHAGVDIGMPVGTTLRSPVDGTVVANTTAGDAGHMLRIRDMRPAGADYVFMHMHARSPLAVGAKVVRGQAVGVSGNSGRSFGPHLHYEVRKQSGKDVAWSVGAMRHMLEEGIEGVVLSS